MIAAQKAFSNTEAAKCHPTTNGDGPAHDAYTRLLHHCQSNGDALWQAVRSCVALVGGVLVIVDSTLDKFYAQAMGLVTRHWSGKHRQVVQGINLVSRLWTDGEAHLPCDFRVYDKPHDQLSKNDHFIGLAVRAFLRLECHRLRTGMSWFEAKIAIVREAVQAYLAQPLYAQLSTA